MYPPFPHKNKGPVETAKHQNGIVSLFLLRLIETTYHKKERIIMLKRNVHIITPGSRNVSVREESPTFLENIERFPWEFLTSFLQILFYHFRHVIHKMFEGREIPYNLHIAKTLPILGKSSQGRKK